MLLLSQVGLASVQSVMPNAPLKMEPLVTRPAFPGSALKAVKQADDAIAAVIAVNCGLAMLTGVAARQSRPPGLSARFDAKRSPNRRPVAIDLIQLELSSLNNRSPRQSIS